MGVRGEDQRRVGFFEGAEKIGSGVGACAHAAADSARVDLEYTARGGGAGDESFGKGIICGVVEQQALTQLVKLGYQVKMPYYIGLAGEDVVDKISVVILGKLYAVATKNLQTFFEILGARVDGVILAA